MNFKRLNIHTYSGAPRGEVEFKNGGGTIKLDLDDQFAREVLAVCADALVRVSKVAAEEMSAKILEAVTQPKLEAKEGDDGTKAG